MITPGLMVCNATYASDNYLYNAFSKSEQDLLLAIDGDKVTLPTLEQVVNPAYGFSTSYQKEYGARYTVTSTRYAMPSNAAAAGKKLGEADEKWWLRYLGNEDKATRYKDVVIGGEIVINSTNYYANWTYGKSSGYIYVRPMIQVKLDPSIKYAGTINVDGEALPYIGKNITYDLLQTPQSISSVNKLEVSIKPTVAAYTGKQIKPTVTVVFNDTKLKKGTDYTVSYGKNKAVGKGTVVIKSTGTRFDTQTRTFQIVPKTPVIKRLKAATKGFQVQVSA